MRKAPAKAQVAVNLGTKRYCSHCNVKFYDFAKPEINCPKCNRVIDPTATPVYKRVVEPKKVTAPAPRDPFDDEADVIVEEPLEASDDDGEDVEVTKGIEVDTDDDN